MATQPAPRLQIITGAGSSPEPRPAALSHEISYQLVFRKKLLRKRRLPFVFAASSDESAIDIMFCHLGIFRPRFRTIRWFWWKGGEKLIRLTDDKQIYPSASVKGRL